MLYLKELTAHDGRDIYEMLQTIDADENGFVNNVKDLPFGEFQAWLDRQVEIANGVNMPDWMVPAKIFWLYEDETPLGQANLRLWLTDALREAGGTIGYAIAKPYRGRGYGKALLALVLEKCQEMGMEEILVTVHPDNLPSRRVAESNGGVLKGENEGHVYYWF